MSKSNIKSKKSVSVKPKKRRGLKIFVAVLCVLVIGGLATSLAFNVLLYKKAGIGSDNKVPPLDGDNVIVTPEDPKPGVALLSIDPLETVVDSDSTVTVPVKVTPDVEDESLKIDWSIKFTNAESEWAAGKRVTDYASVHPINDGALNANITVKQAFAEQIKVTAAVRNKSDVNVSCTVDYVCKYVIEGFEVNSVESEYNECAAQITPIIAKSIGTIDEDITQSISMKVTNDFAGFIDEVIYRPLIKYSSDIYMQSVMNYTETGTDSLTTKRFGIYRDASGINMSFVTLSPDRYKLHMERLLQYHLFTPSPSELENAPLSTYETLWKRDRWNKADDCNILFNTNTEQIFTTSPIEYEGGNPSLGLPDTIPVYKYGLQKIRINTGGNSFTDCYKMKRAFIITCTITGEHNEVTYEQTVPMLFKPIPPATGSLEIDPPSIIV